MSGSSVTVKISKERYESSTYKTTPGGKGHLCKPVIVDIRKTHFGVFSHKRPSASKDVDLLKQTFQNLLGFHPDPYVINDEYSKKETDPLYSVENLKKELKNIYNEEITKDSEMFVCVVLAFGESGYFYLPNDPIDCFNPRSQEPPKFSVNDLLLSFKGNQCPHLILKPKVFLIQTCNPNLVQINKAQLSMGSGPLPQIQRTPIEADILIYQSIISGEYSAHKGNTDSKSACQFVYALFKEVEALTDDREEFELTDLILNVNRSLEDFIEEEYNKSNDGNKSWNIGPPEVPVCIDQLTKKLVLKTRVLSVLLEHLPRQPKVNSVVVDFEAGLWQAIRETLPDLDIHGCVFHWTQAELMVYLEETWINNPLWPTHSWSVFRQSIRTNNDVEGWHRRLNDQSPNGQLPFYVLVPLLHQEANLLPLQRKLVSEGKLCRRQRKTGQQQRIFHLWDLYEAREIRSLRFLTKCGLHVCGNACFLFPVRFVTVGYIDRIKPNTKSELGENIDNIGSTDGKSACQFVYALYKEVTALTDHREEFELTDLILNVNKSLEDFIREGHFKSEERNKPWNIEPPEVPVCIDQLTKKLVLKTQ
ncbi:uncharacterized protein LOC134259296 [Saccostrea cucullata]|uniref:uncharacterized protein LOC134259296 n=1 Tax=Saccostrea cuccullata TaxID=36930 RepID=UPI002ED3FE51